MKLAVSVAALACLALSGAAQAQPAATDADAIRASAPPCRAGGYKTPLSLTVLRERACVAKAIRAAADRPQPALVAAELR
jgi:hypothetical protein